jgi:biopolymer transport protein TolR
MAGHAHRRWRLSDHRKASTDVVRNDINVTPLVDVMLVLLIIFMLMTLIAGRGQEVPLPVADRFTLEKDKLQPVVSVDIDGTLWVEKTRLGPVTVATLNEMDARIQTIWKAPANAEGAGRIYLKADSRLEYSKIYPVLEFMNAKMINPVTGQTVQAVDIAVAAEPKE